MKACEDILAGSFVCEYVGEVMTDDEANRRAQRGSAVTGDTVGTVKGPKAEGSDRDGYMFGLDYHKLPASAKRHSLLHGAGEEASTNKPSGTDTAPAPGLSAEPSEPFVIDGYSVGGVGRFINHRCDGGNLFVQSVFVESDDVRLPHLCLFASMDISAGCELGFDYGYEVGSVNGVNIQCQCTASGSTECRGRLL